MEFLIHLVAINVPRHQEIIHSQSITFLSNVSSVAIVSNDLSFLDVATIRIPVIRMNFSQSTDRSPEAYIIDLRRNWTMDAIQRLKRQVHTKILLITYANLTDSSYFKKLLLCNARYLVLTDDNFIWLDSINSCRGIGEVNYRYCEENISFMDYPPRILYKNQTMRGVEGLMVTTAAESMGINVKFVNRHEVEWGHFGPPYDGLQGDIATGSSIIGFGTLFPFMERYNNADLIPCYYPVQISWAVPIEAGQKQVTWFLVLMSELAPTVWYGVFIVFVSISLTSWAMWKKDRGAVPLHMLSLIIGQAQVIRIPRRAAVFVLFFGLITTSCYTSQMSSFLTAPTPHSDINTLKQLIDSDLRLFSPTPAKGLFAAKAQALPDDYVMAEMNRRFESYDEVLPVVLQRMATKRDCAYCRHGVNIAYIAQSDPTTAGKIHIVEDPVQELFPAFLLPKYSCLTPKFERLFNRIYAAGLGIKWTRDVTAAGRRPAARGPTVLSVEHITGFIYLLLTGWAAAILAFAMEYAIFCLSSAHGKNHSLVLFRRRENKRVFTKTIRNA